MTKIKSFSQWDELASQAVSQTVIDCRQRERHGAWAENHITTQLLGALEGIGTKMAWPDVIQKIYWEGYKLTGTEEKDFGDIAIFVRVWLTEKDYIDGVAYYEAKRQYFDDDNKKPVGFKSIKYKQLDRISGHTHAAHVILYDADLENKVGAVYAVPIQFVKELTKGPSATDSLVTSSQRRLIHYGCPWISRLGNNLRGFELDFSKEGVKAVRALAAESGVSVVLNASVSKASQREPMLDLYFSGLTNLQRQWGNKPAPQQAVLPDEPSKDRDDYDGPPI